MKLSLKSKILIGLALIFSASTIATISLSMSFEHELVKDLAINEATGISQNYFDGLNTLMLTGSMDQAEKLRERIKTNTSIVNIQTIRSKALNDAFGNTGNKTSLDNLETRALENEKIVNLEENGDDRLLTILKPILAETNFNGTNCISCHAVKEGSVLGVIRIDFSLAELDANVDKNFHKSLLTIFSVLVLSCLLAYFLIDNIIKKLGGEPDYVSEVVKQIAAGDLRMSINLRKGDNISILYFLQDMRNKIAAIVEEVHHCSESVTKISQDIGSSVELIKAGTLNQASGSTAIAQSIKHLNDFVSDNTANAEVTGKLANNTAEEAKQGADAVAKTVVAMKDIAKNIRVVEDIAYKTNLLSLNATIEAATAGVHGRGFAVVASEVGKLAEISGKTAEKINDMATQSVEIADHAGELIEKMLPNFVNTSNLVQTISKSSNEQLQSLKQINAEVVELDRSTQQNLANTREIASTVDLLHQEAEDLNKVVAFFKI